MCKLILIFILINFTNCVHSPTPTSLHNKETIRPNTATPDVDKSGQRSTTFLHFMAQSYSAFISKTAKAGEYIQFAEGNQRVICSVPANKSNFISLSVGEGGDFFQITPTNGTGSITFSMKTKRPLEDAVRIFNAEGLDLKIISRCNGELNDSNVHVYLGDKFPDTLPYQSYPNRSTTNNHTTSGTLMNKTENNSTSFEDCETVNTETIKTIGRQALVLAIALIGLVVAIIIILILIMDKMGLLPRGIGFRRLTEEAGPNNLDNRNYNPKPSILNGSGILSNIQGEEVELEVQRSHSN